MTSKTRNTVSRAQGTPGGANGARKDAVAAFPVPSQLATPTDLKAEEVQAVTEAVNGLIADAFALYVKTKNFHCHLRATVTG